MKFWQRDSIPATRAPGARWRSRLRRALPRPAPRLLGLLVENVDRLKCTPSPCVFSLPSTASPTHSLQPRLRSPVARLVRGELTTVLASLSLSPSP